MGKPKILVARKLPPAVEDRLCRDYDVVLNAGDRIYSRDQLPGALEGKDGLIVTPSEKLDAAMIAALPDTVGIIATFSVGYDHIDIPAARKKGLVVTNTPRVLDDATADVAMLLMLAAARRAHEGEALVRADEWRGWHTQMLLGVHVTGKRLGIYGMGRIGQAVARRARGFDMEIHYHNRRPAAEAEALGARYHDSLESLLKVSDFLSVHCPSTDETRSSIDARRLALMPEGAVLVNTARGDIVDDGALIAALRSGRLFAAGLDVFRGEPAIDPRYRELKNVFLLPHLGSATVETRDAMGYTCCDNLDAFFAGRACPNDLTGMAAGE